MKINTDQLRAFVVLLVTSGLPALVAVGLLRWDGVTLGVVDATLSGLVTAAFLVFKASS